MQIYAAPTAGAVDINFGEALQVAEAFAGEVARFAVAAGESTATVTTAGRLPKSRAWQLIQWYYAAYYAAHATLRMFGRSLTFLERGNVQEIEEVAALFGHPEGVLDPGYYRVTAHPTLLRFEHLSGGKGSHFELWKHYVQWMRDLEKDVLRSTAISRREAQRTAVGLADLRGLLSAPPATDGSWLAKLRNEVTYRHVWSAWYPWRPAHGLQTLVDDEAHRLTDAEHEVGIAARARSDLQRFRYTAHAVIALCRALCVEMAERCPLGTSFQRGGLLALDQVLAG